MSDLNLLSQQDYDKFFELIGKLVEAPLGYKRKLIDIWAEATKRGISYDQLKTFLLWFQRGFD